ncbi:MAG TPA: hypothetical protein VIQ60_07755 [Gemmatimonadaceae bacterium]
MTLLLVVPDGIGVRNFVLGSFLHQASERGRVVALHVVPDDLLPAYAGDVPDVEWHRLVQQGSGGRATETLANALGYAHMYWAGTRAMRRRLAAPVQAPTLGRWAMIRTARSLGRVASSPGGIAALDRAHQFVASRTGAVEEYRRLFERVRPSVLFCSHQRPPAIVAPTLAARALGIPTATFIFSWDNLTSKGRIAAPFDHYLVWSEQMRKELLRYYPDVMPDRVHVVGTPQFDPHVDERLQWSREEFFARVGADPSRPLICYSGGDVGTCPEDAAHVSILLEHIRAGRIPGNPQVVLRPAPVDSGARYESVRTRYPELIYAPPEWVHVQPGNWARVMPLAADVAFLANLTRYCDVNVNTASTMTLDFAIHDRPVVNIAFDVASPPWLGQPVWDVYYQYEHYRPVVELGAVRVARSADELATHVSAYLENPALDREARRRLVELEVSLPLGCSNARILDVLDRISVPRGEDGGVRRASAAAVGAR